MNTLNGWTLPCLALILAAGTAHADEESTLVLMSEPEAELPEAVTEAITLPADASDEGVANSAAGLAIANDARERGAEFGAEIAESARDARESFGRAMAGGHLPGFELPDLVPELPEVPVTPAGP